MCIVQCRGKSGSNFRPRLNRKTRAILGADLWQGVRSNPTLDFLRPFLHFPELDRANHGTQPFPHQELHPTRNAGQAGTDEIEKHISRALAAAVDQNEYHGR